MRRFAPLVCLTLVLSGCSTAPSPRNPADDWIAYGRDRGGSRYSPLNQIHEGNVGTLEVAWTYRTGETGFDSTAGKRSAFEATPIKIDDTLYLATPLGRVIALDAVSGEQRWLHDAKVDPEGKFSEVTSRGVSAWLDDAAAVDAACRRTIFAATIDARLIALDARTGAPCTAFGDGGTVDLKKGMDRLRPGQYNVTSPPAIIAGLVVVGSAVGDNGAVGVERGTVRAFDARTGAMRWSWDPIPTKAPADDSWLERGWLHTGAANAWAPISADEQRGLVFIPTSSPSPDYFGGERKGSNAHANSVVALRAATGEVAWSYQLVHHDLWDYDVAAQPMLIDVERDGRRIAAVAAGTKSGFLFVLDRETGEPLFPVEERPVPASDVAGEAAWPTQKFSSLPSLAPQSLRSDGVWGLTEEDREWCRKTIESARNEGLYTPPSLRGTVSFPGNVGGVHWGGMTFDPVRQLLVTNTNRLAALIRLIPRAEVDAFREQGANRITGEFASQRGTPYAMYREMLMTDRFIPCNPPPFGALVAVDLRSGRKAWEVPLGTMPHLSSVPGYESFGSINLGGAITTGGLIFVGASMDTWFRAFDADDGRELWKAELPASAQATPMTYAAGGRQFVVISAGGHGRMGTKRGDYVVAFALPRR